MEPRTATGKRYADTGATKALAFVLAIENEAREQGARTEREDWWEAARRNHGERGHPQPYAECKREVCTWVRYVAFVGDDPR